MEDRVLEFLASKERDSLDLCAFEVEIFEVRSQNLSSFVPFWDDVQILSIFGIKVVVCFNITSLFLSVPAEESQLDCVGESILFLPLQCFLFIFFFLVHHSFHIFVVNHLLFNRHIRKFLISSDVNMEIAL